jgi:nitroimidazol reductase NimA-like FMN-containing flavoprotein (pyridoxamine 5'-phosphate oxidase superfamily)/DNA-binding transcriptional regulator YiaG
MTVNHMSRTGREDEEARWPSPPDPGDLSKRIAQRRAELHLSQAQVAARAGLSLRYLEYLERYPARPAPAALRQLAAALQTTSAALLGGGASVPPWHGVRPADLRVISKLGSAECRRLITPGGVGRIAFSTLDGPMIIPVNFAVLADTIVIRTAVGTVIDGHADGPVALEVDHIDEALHQGWSVLVRGPAHHVTHPAELGRLQEDASVWPWAGGEREVYVRIIPSQITGRRIEIR